MAHTGELMESLEITGDMVRPVHKYSIENDINKLFDTVDIKNSYKALVHSEKNSKDAFSKSTMKRPMRVSSGHISGIGISESVSLKQALRGLCISHASEIAAMKKQSSKDKTFSSGISKARSIRAVMFDASENNSLPEANTSASSVRSLGHELKRSNLNVSRDASVPMSSIVDRDCLYVRAELKKSLKLRNASFGSSSNTKLPVLDENVCDSVDVMSTESSAVKPAGNNNPRVFRRNIVDKRLGSDSTSLSGGSSCCYSGDGHCISSCWSSDSPESSSSRTTGVESDVNKQNYGHKTNDRPRSRKRGKKTSFSSKSSIGDNRSSVSSSEESVISGSSCRGNRVHMSKDLRWKAIRYIEQKQGSLSLKHFKLLKKVGGGDIGNIYLSVLIGTDCVFALKVLDIDLLASRRKLTRAQTEKEILQMLHHPFLPSLYAHFTTEKFSCLVMEFCPGGDLHILRQKQLTRTFSEQATRFYIAEVVLALEYLHMLGVVYRDLKPENVLVQEDGHIMLTDFDLSLKCAVNLTILKTDEHPKPTLSRPSLHVSCIDPFCLHTFLPFSCFNSRFISVAAKTRNPKSEETTLPQLIVEPSDARSNSFVGTHEYLAPEIIKGKDHGSAVDWWTLGILLYELLYGKTPFKARNDDEDTLTNIASESLKFPETPNVSSNARDLIGCLLKKEPQQRLGFEKGAAEIKKHPFFQGMTWALIRCEPPPHVPKSYDMGRCNPGVSGYNIENERSLGDYTIEEDIVLEMF